MTGHLLAAWQHQPWIRLGATVVVVLALALMLHTVLRSLLWRASRGRPVALDMLQRARADALAGPVDRVGDHRARRPMHRRWAWPRRLRMCW